MQTYVQRTRCDCVEAREITADVWAIAIEYESSLVLAPDPWPLLRDIARKCCAQFVRRRRYEVPNFDWALSRTSAADVSEITIDDDCLADLALDILQRLPTKQRLVLDFHWRWGWPYAFIADVLNVSESTVRVHAMRGLDRLKAALEAYSRGAAKL